MANVKSRSSLNSSVADKNRMRDDVGDLQGQQYSSSNIGGVDYPSLNTPLNAAKAGPDPRADVLDPVDPWDSGGEPPDPNEFISHLYMNKGEKESKNRR